MIGAATQWRQSENGQIGDEPCGRGEAGVRSPSASRSEQGLLLPLRRIGCSVPSVLVTRHAALGFAARAGRPPGWLLLAFVWLAFPKARAQGCLVIAGNLPVLLELADAGVTISARQCLERLQALLRRGVAAPPVRSPTQ